MGLVFPYFANVPFPMFWGFFVCLFVLYHTSTPLGIYHSQSIIILQLTHTQVFSFLGHFLVVTFPTYKRVLQLHFLCTISCFILCTFICYPVLLYSTPVLHVTINFFFFYFWCQLTINNIFKSDNWGTPSVFSLLSIIIFRFPYWPSAADFLPRSHFLF